MSKPKPSISHHKSQVEKDAENHIFRLLVENSSDGMALFENQELVYASPSMNTIFGCKDFYKFKNYAEILNQVHPDDYPTLEQIVNEGRKNKIKHQKYQFRFKREDDTTYCWIENSVTRIYDSHGNNFRNIVTCRDITNSKRIEIELSRQTQLLKAITDHSDAFIYTKDTGGRFTFVNKAFGNIFNINPEELIGLTDSDLTNETDSEKYRNTDQIVIQTGKSMTVEETLNLPGEQTTAISLKVPLFDNAGNITGICGISTDITERKKAEQKLLQLQEKLEIALTAGNLGLWEWYANGNRVDWFGKHAELFGLNEKEFDGSIKTIKELMHHEDRNKGTEAFEKSIKEGVAFSNVYRVIWPDGSMHWLHSYGTPVYNENGEAFKVVGTTHDITTEKEASNKIISQNKELSRLNAMKDKLFSIVSHDLKNPLNSLLGFVQLLNLNYSHESQGAVGKYIHLISKSAYSMAELLNTLSQWSYSQRRKMKVNPHEVSPLKMVEEISSLSVANQHNKNLNLEIDIPAVDVAFGDEDMIKTVLRNYLDNAIKFSNPEGKITISGAIDGDSYTFKISDNGVGMKPDRLKNLFSVSSFGSEPGTAGEKGTGLGLIICKDLADLNYGKVWAESKKDKGSDFYFSIPANKTSWDNSTSMRSENL